LGFRKHHLATLNVGRIPNFPEILFLLAQKKTSSPQNFFSLQFSFAKVPFVGTRAKIEIRPLKIRIPQIFSFAKHLHLLLFLG
jgi:hypothetical protein